MKAKFPLLELSGEERQEDRSISQHLGLQTIRVVDNNVSEIHTSIERRSVDSRTDIRTLSGTASLVRVLVVRVKVGDGMEPEYCDEACARDLMWSGKFSVVCLLCYRPNLSHL